MKLKKNIVKKKVSLLSQAMTPYFIIKIKGYV